MSGYVSKRSSTVFGNTRMAGCSEAVPGKHTLTDQHFGGRAPGHDAGEPDPAAVRASAQRGIATPASPLPHAETIQRLFGRHDISGIQAHTGPEAMQSAREMRAEAYATGNHVVLGDGVNLHTIAHEAAHVIQQRGGVLLKSGVGVAGDAHERHADEVADRVVRGDSAEGVLDQLGAAATPHRADAIQKMRRDKPPSATAPEDSAASETVDFATDDFCYLVNGNYTKNFNAHFDTPGPVRYATTDGVADCIAVALEGKRKTDNVTVHGFFHLSSHEYSEEKSGGRKLPSNQADVDLDEYFQTDSESYAYANIMYRVQQFFESTEVLRSVGITSQAPARDQLRAPLGQCNIRRSSAEHVDVSFDAQTMTMHVTGGARSRSYVELVNGALRLPESTREERQAKIKRLTAVRNKLPDNKAEMLRVKCQMACKRLQQVDSICLLQ